MGIPTISFLEQNKEQTIVIFCTEEYYEGQIRFFINKETFEVRVFIEAETVWNRQSENVNYIVDRRFFSITGARNFIRNYIQQTCARKARIAREK